MKKVIMVSLFALVTMVSYSQNKTNVGFMGGFGLNSSVSANYGMWVDFGGLGVSVTRGASLSNEDPTDYIYGNASKYTAGNSYTNFGLHYNNIFKNKNLFTGVGVQSIRDISTNGFEKAQITPYVNFGAKKEIFYGIVRAEVVLAKIPSINVGWGFSF